MATLCLKISALWLLTGIIFGIVTDQLFFRRCAVASSNTHKATLEMESQNQFQTVLKPCCPEEWRQSFSYLERIQA